MKKDYTKEDLIDFMLYYNHFADGRKYAEVIEEWEFNKPKRTSKELPIPWIKEWINLWPVGVKSGGKYLRSDEVSCLKKMTAFTKNFPQYSKDTIMDATSAYLDMKADQDWNYTLCAVNFINHRDKGSELASCCEVYLKAFRTTKIEEGYEFNRSNDI